MVISTIPAIQNAVCFLEEVNIAFGTWYVTINMVTAFFLFLCKIAVIRRYIYIPNQDSVSVSSVRSLD